uniref:Uncharacterized protein n=1 Tax=Hyaloperonospora arabidopsidis (strain Emoy2) TaxID=559515 RepID=M4C6B1_HYAAE
MERRDTCPIIVRVLLRAFNHIDTLNESILYESYGLSIISIAEHCRLLLS